MKKEGKILGKEKGRERELPAFDLIITFVENLFFEFLFGRVADLMLISK